jgi:diguanylate cyclase (GGDEF)-like protein
MVEYSNLLNKIKEVFPNDYVRLFNELDFVELHRSDLYNIDSQTEDGLFQINNFLNISESEKFKKNLNRVLDTGNLEWLINELNERFERTTCELTGFVKRDFFDANIDSLINMANKNSGFNFSYVMCDLDNFKSLNDNYGHIIGDDFLNFFGSLVRNKLRGIDSLLESANIGVRYGGEEFVFLLSNTDVSQALKISERIRSSVYDRLVIGEGEIGLGVYDLNLCSGNVDIKRRVSCSLGISNYSQLCNTRLDLMKFADDALYEAKHTGRNKVCVASNLN